MDPIWAPHVIANLKDSDLGHYLDFSCTACIPGGGCNVDRALQVLYQANGDIKLATEKLLNDTYQFWTEDEMRLFERLFSSHGKNFFKISRDLKTKSVKDCVEFYYLWKKLPRHQHHEEQHQRETKPPPVAKDDQFPCKVCGRIFEKIKSRSAHMKRHKNEK